MTLLSENTQSLDPVRAKLVEESLDFARNSAAKAAQKLPKLPTFTTSDAIQAGYEGLMRAAYRFDIEKYDPTKGTLENHFRSFAYPRIVGSVIDRSRRDSFVRRRGLEKGIEFKFDSLDEFDEEHTEVQLSSQIGDIDLKVDFDHALASLTKRERVVIMAIASGAKLHEIGDRMGVSESRISQIAKEARTKMMKALEGYDFE